MIVAIHGLRKYLDHTYRRLLDVLHEMHGIVAKLDPAVTDLPSFTTACTRKQDLEMRIWRVLLRLSVELHDLGDVQAIDATSMNRIATSQHYAKQTNARSSRVPTRYLVRDCRAEEPHGFAVKDEFDDDYEQEINYGRLYPNLDDSVDKSH